MHNIRRQHGQRAVHQLLRVVGVERDEILEQLQRLGNAYRGRGGILVIRSVVGVVVKHTSQHRHCSAQQKVVGVEVLFHGPTYG